MTSTLSAPAAAAPLIHELNWLERVIKFRVSQHIRTPYYETDPQTRKISSPSYADFTDLLPPAHDPESVLGKLLVQNNMTSPEARLLLALGLGTHFHPGVYSVFFSSRGERLIPHWAGGSRTQRYSDILPAGLTWLWLVADTNLDKRLALIHALQSNEWQLLRDGKLYIAPENVGEPAYSGLIGVQQELLRELFPVK